jgi:hypothetical protein
VLGIVAAALNGVRVGRDGALRRSAGLVFKLKIVRPRNLKLELQL